MQKSGEETRARSAASVREVYSSIKRKETREGKEEARQDRGERTGRGGEVGCARARERERASERRRGEGASETKVDETQGPFWFVGTAVARSPQL